MTGSYTTRINYDYTLSPTLLLHVGMGYVNQHGPTSITARRWTALIPASIGLKGTSRIRADSPISPICARESPAALSPP